jgi:drug/metabolite transporter (DMT)-like permease
MPRPAALREPGPVRGVGSLLGAATAFAAVSVLAKRAYEAGSEPVSLLGVRMIVAAVLLSATAALRGPGPGALVVASHIGTFRQWGRAGRIGLTLFAGAGFAAAGLGEFEALARASAPTVVLLVFVAPVWVALAGWLLRGDTPGWAGACVLAALLAGLALVVATPDGSPPSRAAVALALGASAMSAAFFIALDELGRRTRPHIAACGAAWVAAAVVVPLDPGGIARELLRPQSTAYGVAIGALTALALWLLASGVRASSALTASAVICAEPVVAAVLSWLLLDELLTGTQVAGGALVLLSVTALPALSGRAPPGCAATGRTRRPRPGSPRRRRPARSARRRRSGGRSRGRRG